MNNLNKILAGIIFLFSLVVYILTMAPTTSFWDCGEFIATSVIMGVPHPPGTPLYLLLGNFFSQLPTFADTGARVNLISPIFSAFAVMFLYLIIVQLIEQWHGKAKSWPDFLIIYGSAIIGALTFAFTDSHWFNAVEAEVYSLSTFFTSIVVWLILKWNKNSGHDGNVRYILIIAYMFGLAIGIHLLNLLALPFIALIIYFNKFEFKLNSFFITIGATLLTFLTIYLGIVKGIPNLANSYGLYVPIFLILFTFIAMMYAIIKKYNQLSTILTCLVLILIGFSTYTTIFIRATQHPNINENNPDTIKGALAYMNRDQYGDWEILNPAFTLARGECSYSSRWTNDKNNPSVSEQLNFLWNYQIKEMYLRYFAWQFVGKEDHNKRSWDLVTLKGETIKTLRGIDWGRYVIPFPLLFGIFGMIFHFSRDWKRALAVLALFLATGIMIVLYLNQYDPQPRERDYSFVGSFFTFSICIGIGIAALQEKIKDWLEGAEIAAFISIGLTGIIFIIMPITMLATDFKEHNRTGNYVAWDYAYNMLNSCEPNGIIFTNGDNDTFPLWYIQEVEGIRKDVRVVNLSLLNTPWYIEQLKNIEPKINLNLKDENILKLDPVFGTAYALNKWTSEWSILKEKYNQYTKSQYGVGYSVSNFGILSKWGPSAAKININGQKLEWEISPKLSNYLRVQDIMILQIIEDAIEDRPIYFAVTVSPNNRMGLDNYLQMEGLVYKVTFENSGIDKSMPRLNYNRMLQNITESPNLSNKIVDSSDYLEHINAGNGIYRYTNLNNSKVYFNENIQRLIQNYRSSFLQLGLENLYSGEEGGKSKTLDILSKMDDYFPQDVIPTTDPELDIQIGRIYKEAGNPEQLKIRLEAVSKREDVSLETQMYIGQILINEFNDYESAIQHYEKLFNEYPYISDFLYTLVQTYAKADRNEDAIEKLNFWIQSHPNDSQAIEWLSILTETANK